MRSQNEAMRRLAENVTLADAKKLLDGLRWREDMVVKNHEGDRVWLGVCYDKDLKRIGITDCCFEDFPCDRHAAMAK